MIDLHCHLDLYPNPEEVAEECSRRKMYVLSVTTTPSSWAGTKALAFGHQRIRTALGLHPQLARERVKELAGFRHLVPTTRYVGEVGLDGSPECLPYWNDQMRVFDDILRSCAEVGGRILSIHSRRAEKDVLSRLEHYSGAGKAVLHWFTGSAQELERAIDLGCWFSVGFAMLRSNRGRRLAERIPRERVLTESDGPFVRCRGRPAMPWDVYDAIQELGKLWRLSALEVNSLLLANLRTLVRGSA